MNDWIWLAIIVYIAVAALMMYLYRNNLNKYRVIDAVAWPIWVTVGIFLWLIYKLIMFIINH